ncbi:MAG: IclR family transcriptional regulator [Acidimicrobiales bacterium]
MKSPSPSGTTVRSVARAARWLLWIAENEGATATEVARAFEVPVPTVHHVLSTLAQEGLLEKDAAHRYYMGPRIGALSAAFVREQAVPIHWQRALAELAASTGETAYLAAWRGGDIRILAGVEGTRAVRVPDVQIGLYGHAHARATGKLLLALAPPSQRDEYLALHPPSRLTSKTLTTRPSLDAEFERIREMKFATDCEEFADGLSCLSVPILQGGSVLGAFAVAAPSQRFSAEQQSLLRKTRRAATEAALRGDTSAKSRLPRGASK